MKFNKEKIEKKIKQKQIRLSEKNNDYLITLSERFNMTETDIVNVLLDNLGREISFIKECEEKIEEIKKEDENLNLRRNIKIISLFPIFVGYYPVSNQNYFAYQNIDIFLEDSLDKNFKYFITYQKKISILNTPNSNVPKQNYFFNESKYVNDLYNEFKEQGLNINNLIIDKNYNNVISSGR